MYRRDLQVFVRDRIDRALGVRSWSWLARATRVPQSTLAAQRGKPRFSLDVLVSVAEALGRPLSDFLPADDPAIRAGNPTGLLRELYDLIAKELSVGD